MMISPIDDIHLVITKFDTDAGILLAVMPDDN